MSSFEIPRPRKGSVKIQHNKSLQKSGPPDSRAAAPTGTGNGGTSKTGEAKKPQNKTYNNSDSASRALSKVKGPAAVALNKTEQVIQKASQLTPQHVAKALGGEARGNQVLVPGPGHKPNDRSLSIKLDPKAPDRFIVNSFSPRDTWKGAKDHVRKKLKLPSRAKSDKTIIATYIYQQANNTNYLRVQRTRDKTFWQSHWDCTNDAVPAPTVF
jgi:hypothetical protein